MWEIVDWINLARNREQ